MTAEYCLLWTDICLASDTWAAWAQAVFSVLAIVVAIWIPTGMARAVRKDRYYAIVYLITAVEQRAMQLTKSIGDRKILAGSVGRDEEFDRLVEAIKSIPTHDLPESGLIIPLLESTRYAEEFQKAYAEATQFGDLPNAAWPTQHLRLLNLVNKIIEQMVFCSRMGKYLYGSPIRRWLMRRETRRSAIARATEA